MGRVESPAVSVVKQQTAGFVFCDGPEWCGGFGPREQIGGFCGVGGPAAGFLFVARAVQYGDVAAIDFLDLV